MHLEKRRYILLHVLWWKENVNSLWCYGAGLLCLSQDRLNVPQRRATSSVLISVLRITDAVLWTFSRLFLDGIDWECRYNCKDGNTAKVPSAQLAGVASRDFVTHFFLCWLQRYLQVRNHEMTPEAFYLTWFMRVWLQNDFECAQVCVNSS